MSHKRMSRRQMLKGLGAAAAGAALAACQPKTVVVEKVVTQEVEKVVKETVIVEGTPQVVEKVVKETVVVKEEGSDLLAKAADEAIVSAAGSGEVVLEFWNGLTGDDGVVMIKILQAFSQQNPEVTVKMQRIPWGIYFEKLMPAFVAGSGPDVFILHGPGSEVYEWSRRGTLLTMDEMFDDGMLPKDDFNSTVLDGCTFEGEVMAIPLDSYCPVLWCNVSVFEEAGVEFDPERGPMTRGEFMELCTQLTRDVNGKHPGESGFDPEQVEVYGYGGRDMVGETVRQNGVDSVSLDGTCKATVTDPLYIDGLQWGVDIVHTYHYKAYDTWAESEQRLAAGKQAMQGNGSWFYDWFRLHPEVTKRAAWQWPATGKERGIWTGTHGLCLPIDGDPVKIEWGKKMIQFISGSHMWAAEAGMPTPRKSVAEHPLIATNWALPNELEQLAWAYPPNTSYPCPSEVGGILNPVIATVLNGEQEPLPAMQEIEPRIQQVLDRCCTG